MLGAQPDEIAFVSSTSMGLSMVASGLSWHMGDNIIVADGDFPSNIYPWLNLRSRGVEVRFIPRRADGGVTPEDVLKLADGKTRLVSLSSVNYITGYAIDVPAIGKLLHDKGILFCVDAIQGLGVLPMDTAYVDFLASGSHKWLLGPLGIGILFVKKCHIGDMTPALTGWKCVQASKKYLNYNLCFLETAGRLEPGGMNITGILGLHAALQLLLETGIGNIASRLAVFRNILKPVLKEKGYEVLGPADDERCSGIISFSCKSLNIEALRQGMDDAGFVVSLREGLDGHKCIRVAPHFYNTEDELRRFAERLPTC